MKTHTISFRCPEEILKEMELLCEHNRVDRSGFIVQAIQSLMGGLARKGVVKPKASLPTSPMAEDK
ncbi:MAG: hypothetical protein IKJ29_05495 [Akkermansia sp.]|nr:hypothetical protein [Akkermansia sp.]